jgi:hypothetical protein
MDKDVRQSYVENENVSLAWACNLKAEGMGRQ